MNLSTVEIWHINMGTILVTRQKKVHVTSYHAQVEIPIRVKIKVGKVSNFGASTVV